LLRFARNDMKISESHVSTSKVSFLNLDSRIRVVVLVHMIGDTFRLYLVIASRNSEPSEEDAWQSLSPPDCFALQWKGSQ